MKAIFGILSIILILNSCRKPDLEKGIVTGIVSDKSTNDGIGGATIYLLAHEPDGSIIGGGGGPSFLIDTTTSDSQGNFSFNFDYDDKYAYTCSAIKALYFDYDEEFHVEDNVKSQINVEIALQPMAYLQLHIKAVNDYEPSDFISIQDVYDGPYYGDEIDISKLITVNGNSIYSVVWFIFIGGVTEGSESADIYCPSFDTSYYEILY